MLRLLNRFLGPLLLALLCLDGYGQDVHWTQVNTLRSLQNPAENGITEELDATLAYRNQWGSLMNAFSTIGLNVNGRLTNGIGLGFTAIDDRAGSAGWHQTNVYLNGSYATSIRNIRIRFGLGLGVIQQGFDQTQALFPDQIGNNLSLNPTSQTFNTIQDIGFDNTVGLFAQIPIGKNELKIGLNHNHLLQSELSLAGNTSSATGLWNAFLSYPITLNPSYGLQPYVAYFNQAGIQQAVFGSNISYTKNNVVYGGLGYRLQDAITAQVGIQYNQLRAGVAYDYTIGSLRQNAGNTSAFELMIGYGFSKKNKSPLELDTMVEVTEPMPVEAILVYTYQITENDSVTKLNGARFVLTENDPGNFRRDTMLENNLIAFVLNPCAKYTLTVSKQGYFTKEERFSTPCEIKGSVHKEFIIAMDSLEVNKTYTLQHIYYDFNEASLTNASLDELKKLAEFLTENPTIRIELSSHTDNKGEDAYNMKLSEKRAQSCVDYLINLGIAADRLVAKGYGESKPVADNELEDGSDNPEGRALNRRTEFKILNLK